MKRSLTISAFLVIAIVVASYFVRIRISERKRLWAEQVMSVSKDVTVRQALEILGQPINEWKTVPAHLSRYSNGSISNYSRVLMFLRVNQGAFVYVGDNDLIISAEVFEQ